LDSNLNPKIADFGFSREKPENSLNMSLVGTV
jgi:hypothetical protein